MHSFALLGVQIVKFSSATGGFTSNPAKVLFKHLMREAEKLPKGPKQHYKFMIKQSFMQHMNESDQERIDQIISRSYEDCEWILKKVGIAKWYPQFFNSIWAIPRNKMFPVPLVVSSNTISVAQFWEAILVYHNRPHLVNRKLAGHCQVLFYEIDFNPSSDIKLSEIFTRSAILYEVRKLKTVSKRCIDESFLQKLIECYDKNVNLKKTTIPDFEKSTSGVYLSVRILLPRIKGCENCVEVVILDKNKNEAIFHGVSDNDIKIAPPFPYKVELSSGNMKIVLDDIEYADTSSAEWLSNKLFEKLIKWACEEGCGDEDTGAKSLSLIDIETYVLLYHELKAKYAEPLLKVWSEQAKTDPKKYVYEDIAIAAYLICLWSKYTVKEEVRFVDLGCGNGLLVYFLNREGYRGYGVDLRRRKTWDLYNGLADLREEAVTPDSLYSESNWLIGNHSDELTPWIPIMALKSSPATNFFVLPCCSYELNGKKFIRYDSSVSQYSNYLSYVETICNLCQFTSHFDKLRIPSTKRTCIVGIQNSSEHRNDVLNKVDEFVKSKCSASEGTSFTLRPAVEPVRNCTQLGKSVIDSIVNEIVSIILKMDDLQVKADGTKWNKGGYITLACLSKLLSFKSLAKLKKESGGLQTLLKNHRYIFQLQGGFVSLRGPLLLNEDTKKYKDKPCWFLNNHPDGCLYSADVCAYKHE